jgi:ABC-type multidrug transport system ATPase subunit
LSSDDAIRVEELTKTYHPGRPDEVRAVDGISFAVRKGEVFGMLGPNGAGKTTLVNVLTTLTLPTSGRAWVMGHDVVEESLAVRRSIAVVLQQFAVEQYLTVRDNFITFGKFHGISIAESRRRAERVLSQFHLEEHASKKAQDLSVGTKRRVQVAKMFLVDSPVLFLDEPSIGMDPFVRRELLATIQEQARGGRTIFLTTQVLSEAEELCDHIVIVDSGKIAAEGDLASLKRLSRGFYNVTLSFPSVGEELLADLRRAKPTRLEVKRNLVEMTLHASESEALEWLAALARQWPVSNVEVRGASLEDVFFELLGRAAKASSAASGNG